MNRGYIKLWRKTLDSGLLQNGPAWQLFGYLMLKASHKPVTCIVSGQVVKLFPGQAVFGRLRAAKDLGLSERQIRTAQKLLENMQIVTSRATNRFTVLTFVNWDTYQAERPAGDQQNDQQTTSRRPTNDHVQEQEKNINTSHPVESLVNQDSARSPERRSGGAEATLPFSADSGSGVAVSALVDLSGPGMEFVELRDFYTREVRPEGPLDGFCEYKALKAARDGTGMSVFPGLSRITADLMARKKAGCWGAGFEIGLARYLKSRAWLSPILPRASPPSGRERKQQDRDTIAARVSASMAREYRQPREEQQHEREP